MDVLNVMLRMIIVADEQPNDGNAILANAINEQLIRFLLREDYPKNQSDIFQSGILSNGAIIVSAGNGHFDTIGWPKKDTETSE